MTGPTEPAAEIRAEVEHSAEGTLVHGTSRTDVELVQLLKAQGFRWSRNLDAWYLPRTWTESTRTLRVRALQRAVGAQIAVEQVDAPRRSPAEREAEKQERARARAERMDDRAEAAEQRAKAEHAARQEIQSYIPLGQPVLVGHHSQRRHERALDKIDRHMARAVSEERKAEDAREAAEHARRVAAGRESVVTIDNRIERKEAERRKAQRRLETAEGTYRDRLVRLVAELDEEIAHDRAKLEAAGGVSYSRETVRPGDLVRIRGTWYPVLRSNAKTVSVPHAMAAADSTWSHTAPWREVQAHLPYAEATRAQVLQRAAAVSRAFPGLAARIREHAESLPEEEGRARGAGA